MAITKQLKNGAPADDAEITSAPTNLGKLDDNVAAAVCTAHRMELVGDSSKYYDKKTIIFLSIWNMDTHN